MSETGRFAAAFMMRRRRTRGREVVFNERRDARSGELTDRSAIAKLTCMLAF